MAAIIKSLSLYLYSCEAGDEEIVEGRGRKYRVTYFGVTPMGKTVCLRVTDFHPYFHVHLALPLTPARFDAFVDWLRSEVCPSWGSIPGMSRGGGTKFVSGGAKASKVAAADTRMTARTEMHTVEETYAGEGMRPCIRLEFDSEQLRKKALKFLRAPDTRPPFLLRSVQPTSPRPDVLQEQGAHAVRRARGYETYGGKLIALHAFLHTYNLQPNGWATVRLETPRVVEPWSTGCQAEYEVMSIHLKSCPDRLDPAPLLVASYDGEMGSSHGDFPVPVKDYSKPAAQIVEMCARHVHGVTVEAATTFLHQALEHMFPEEVAAAVMTPPERQAQATSPPTLPIDCVYFKKCPYDATTRSSWIDAMVTLFVQQPLAKLLAMSAGRMSEVVQTLRVAAVYEKQRLAAKKAQEEREAAEEAGGDDEDERANAALGEANQESLENFAALTLEGSGGGYVTSGSPIDELLQKTELPIETTTFVDVLRAHLNTDAAARAMPLTSSLGKQKWAQGAAQGATAAPVLTQQQKTQLLNQLFTLCLPPLEGDPITFIGTVFERQAIIQGQPTEESHIVVSDTCAPIPGVVVHAVCGEKALLLKWAELMRAKRPHFLLSFNGFGFDNKFFYLRAREHGIADEVFAFSRQQDCNGLVRDWRTDTEGLDVHQCRLASGDYSMESPRLPGVKQIDQLFYFRREHPGYTSYSLDSVAMANLNDKVKAMDTVSIADVINANNACDGSRVLLDWTDPLTVRPREDADRLLRLETGNLAGLYIGNYICLQLLDGQLAATFLTEAAWYATKKNNNNTGGHNSDARHKIQVLGIEKSADGKRQCLLVDVAVADAVRYQIAIATAERLRMLGDEVVALTSSSSSAKEKAPPNGLATLGQAVPCLGAGLQWSLVKDDVPHQEIFRLAKGSAADRAVVGKYCVGDCTLPLVLARKLGVLPWYLETASLCCVDTSTLVFNGQGVKLQSYVAKACFANRTLLRDLEKEVVAYDGATVLEPRIAAQNDEPVAVNDFSSLYPSIMAAWNLSPGTRCWAIFYSLGTIPGPKPSGPNLAYLEGGGLGTPFAFEGVLKPACDRRPGETPFLFHGLPGREYVYTWYTLKTRVPSLHGGEDKVVVVGNKMVCWFAPKFADSTHSAASHPLQAGIYPQQALGLLAARQAKKNLQKQDGLDPFVKAVYKLQELVVKCANNSVYGQLGSATSALRDLDVAASICSIGRLHIIYTKTLVEKLYADRIVHIAPFGKMRARSCYVYGDTDSVFFCFNLETLDPAVHAEAFVPDATAWTGAPQPIRGRVALLCANVLAANVARLVTDTGPRPMGLAYEKTFMKFFIVSKKKYAGIKYEVDKGELTEGKLSYMGLQVKKRDSCDCVRDVFGTVMARMLQDADDVVPIVRYLTAVVKSIVEGKLPPSKFLITKTLKSGYSKPLTVPHNVLADRIEQRTPGTRPKPGDRITYAFVVPDKGTVGMGPKGQLLMGQRIDTLVQIESAKLKIDYETYVRTHIQQPVVQLLSLLVKAIVRKLGSSQDRAELAEVTINTAAYAQTDLVRYNKIMKMASKRLVERIVFEPFLRELTNKNRGLQDISSFFKGSECSRMPQLGPLIQCGVKGGKKSTGNAPGGAPAKGALQKTMKGFFHLGSSKHNN